MSRHLYTRQAGGSVVPWTHTDPPGRGEPGENPVTRLAARGCATRDPLNPGRHGSTSHRRFR